MIQDVYAVLNWSGGHVPAIINARAVHAVRPGLQDLREMPAQHQYSAGLAHHHALLEREMLQVSDIPVPMSRTRMSARLGPGLASSVWQVQSSMVIIVSLPNLKYISWKLLKQLLPGTELRQLSLGSRQAYHTSPSSPVEPRFASSLS